MPAPPSIMSVPGQVTPNQQPAVTQHNFNQMVGILLQHNPDSPIQMCMEWIRSSYRRIVDHRLWYGLMVKGEVPVPAMYTTGTVSVTNGSPIVTGVGTVWDNTFIGRTFRVGFTSTRYQIVSVQSGTQMTLELPWGAQNYSSVGYQVVKNIVSLGPNVKRVLVMLNMMQGFPARLGMPQEVANTRDTWRTQTGFTYMLLSYPPSQAGEPQWELYPSPLTQQGFPFIAYVQPPDLGPSQPWPYAFIRSDVIIEGAMPDALLYRGKQSKYYDPQSAAYHRKNFDMEIEKMARNDDNHYLKDLLWDYKSYPLMNFGADYHQTHLDEGDWM